ncbi:MAG: hypothetical protein AMK73_05240 [Planctomycetes bacterium SM23_32]|nr:MAG: hypothetical protein AMK73_05240 [Planctomycetes bacterium SM23_32]
MAAPAVALLLCCLVLPALADTLRVARDGQWTRIQEAINAARPGDTVEVAHGRYAETVTIAKSDLTLRAAPGDLPLIDGAGEREYGIHVPRDVAVEGLRIEGFEVARQTRKGIFIESRASRGIGISGNVVHHMREKGIDVCGAEHLIEGNVIYMIGNDQEAMGIRLEQTRDCVARDNDAFLCKKTAIRDQTGAGNLIESNLMHMCWCGLDFNASSGARALNNCIYCNLTGFNPKHLKGNVGWNLFRHNSLYGNRGENVCIAVNRADWLPDTGPDLDWLDIQNNILGPCGYTHLWNRPQIVGENVVVDNNVYCGEPGWPPHFYQTEWHRSKRPGLTSLARMQAETGFGTSGRIADSPFLDPEHGDLDYADDSPLASLGADLGDPRGRQLGARGVRRPVTRFVRVAMNAVAASVNEGLMHYTTDGRYYTEWHSGTGTEDQWITYELTDRRPFTHLILVPVGHKVEFNIRRYEFLVSEDGHRFEMLFRGENNDSGSTFIYELDEPVAPRFLKLRMLEKFPDDGLDWTPANLQLDELMAGFFEPSLDAVPRLGRPNTSSR